MQNYNNFDFFLSKILNICEYVCMPILYYCQRQAISLSVKNLTKQFFMPAYYILYINVVN